MLRPSYSRRRRIQYGTTIDVYEYGTIPTKVRIQTIQIIENAIGEYYTRGNLGSANQLYASLVREIRREQGLHKLLKADARADQELFGWIEHTASVDDWLDAVELCLQTIVGFVREHIASFPGRRVLPDDAIAEFNARMLEAAVGYQFNGGEIPRIDSQYLHADVVVPALNLLNDRRFASENEEYRSAHAAYRSGELEDCIVDCAKSFESVLKIIGTARGWQIKETDPASKIIQAAAENGLIASYHTSGLNHLKGLLESSTPTVRNKEGGHGAGVAVRSVSRELAALQLHQTAAMIVFLASRDAAMP